MSAEKTLDILDLFNMETRELSVPQIAEMLNQPHSSVYRNLRFLKEKRFVIETNGGTYKLGYRFLELAKIVRTDNSISSIVLPLMRDITKETEETSILTIMSGLHAVCLETVASPQSIKVSAEQGQLFPLYAGASSKPLLAHMPEEKIKQMFQQGIVRKHTEQTIVEVEELIASLQEVREKGYAISDSEVDEGVLAYGVPIRDFNNDVVAALSIAGPRERMLVKDRTTLVHILQSAVQEIQKNL